MMRKPIKKFQPKYHKPTSSNQLTAFTIAVGLVEIVLLAATFYVLMASLYVIGG